MMPSFFPPLAGQALQVTCCRVVCRSCSSCDISSRLRASRVACSSSMAWRWAVWTEGTKGGHGKTKWTLNNGRWRAPQIPSTKAIKAHFNSQPPFMLPAKAFHRNLKRYGTCICKKKVSAGVNSSSHICRVGRNHTYTVYIR